MPNNTHPSQNSQSVPIRIRKADPSLPLPSTYSTTPHGTIFSTTPGGTRIIYDRHTLLNLRNSPLSRTPPATLGFVPGVTKVGSLPNKPSLLHNEVKNERISNPYELLEIDEDDEDKDKKKSNDHGEMFDMEME